MYGSAGFPVPDVTQWHVEKSLSCEMKIGAWAASAADAAGTVATTAKVDRLNTEKVALASERLQRAWRFAGCPGPRVMLPSPRLSG
jgi:hypothetical protein